MNAADMPASSSDSVGHIEEALTGSLKGGSTSSIDEQLVSSSKKILLSNIQFKPAEKQLNNQLDNLRSKYIFLNPSKKDQGAAAEVPGDGKSKKMSVSCDGGDEGLPKPKVVLYPPEKVNLEWREMRKVGAGLINMGNTCFLNSTLQCLTYTPPLANYLVGNEHTAACKQAGFCMLCELQRHIRRCYEHAGQAVRPQCILQKLKLIAKHMQWGRQEDAHEFLRYVIEAAQKTCLNGYAKLDKFSKETTVVNQIFGGYLRSQVICQRCKAKSNTYDPFLDISLDIKNAGSLEKAFDKFVQPETLESDNAYSCPRCKHKVSAQKLFTINKAPNTLTVQLKRFDYNRCYGGKVTRHIHFPEKLNLRPYMSLKQGPAVMYQLYAVLVHSGGSCNSGHYYSYIKAANGLWHCMNDSMVQQASINRVMSAEAYLLFYRRYQPKEKVLENGNKDSSHQKSKPIGKISATSVSRHISNDIGKPVTPKPSTVSATVTAHGKPSTILPASQRDKISFGIKPTPQKPASEQSQPRIVMHIKNGKVNITEKPAVSTSSVATTTTTQPSNKDVHKRKLVPYNSGDSTSDSDAEDGESTAKKVCPLRDGSKDKKKEQGAASSAKVSAESISPTKLAIKLSKANATDNAVVMDKTLNATTSVPGAILPTHKNSDQEPSSPAMSSAASGRMFSPVKRVLNDGHLTCVTTPMVSPKINATTSKWQILQADSQVSPSVASESSNTSANSTTEWHVLGNGETQKTPTLPEAQCSGWTVRTEEQYKMFLSSKHNKESGKSKPETAAQHSQSAGTLQPESVTDKANKKLCQDDIGVRYSSTLPSRKSQDDLFLSPSTVRSCVDADKSTNSSHNGAEESVSKISNGCADGEVIKSPTSGSDASQSLTEDATTTTSSHEDRSHHKKHRKHKKHKKHREHDQSSDEVRADASLSADAESSAKKHKKKKHKHRHHDQDHSERHDSDRKHRKRHSSSESELFESKRSGRDVEYEWVERTKDNLAWQREDTRGRHADEPAVSKDKREAPSQHWDQHIKDGYKRAHEGGDHLKLKIKQHWDGSRSTSHSVVEQLHAAARPFASKVSSWDGGRSVLDTQSAKDFFHERKRHWSDDYEEELDHGKVKKVKQRRSEHSFGNPHNPFQGMQEWKTAEKDRHKQGGYSSDRDRGDARHHHYHHKSYHRHSMH